MTVSRRSLLTATLGGLFVYPVSAFAAEDRPASPHVLITPSGRDALREKIARYEWAKAAYGTIKASVDHYAALCETDPAYLTSRLLLNWNTHYTHNFVQKDKWVRGDGFAPVPTPRFAGARDWATPWSLPAQLDDYRPFNDAPDKSGKLWLIHSATQKGEWTHPAPTGRTIEVGNQRVMALAADAAFVYFVEGSPRYARMASDVLTTYLSGMQYVSPPVVVGGKDGTNPIIGTTSFEVIHEGILQEIGPALDFLRPYLAAQNQNLALLEAQIKRMCDRVIDGGNAVGNWNLNQAFNFSLPGLALQDNDAYPDKKGRQYYADVLLNARLPHQTGILHVIKEDYDAKTALWPEAPGYGFGTTPQLLRFATLLQNTPAAASLLQDPFLTRAVLAQQELLFPDGYSTGLGDTINTRIRSDALELGIASARARGDKETEARLTDALEKEVVGGFYDRGKQTDLFALTHFVGDLRPGNKEKVQGSGSRTYFGEPLNIVMQRNAAPDGNPAHALAAALYGTKGGHVHSNGMTMELFGAGLILGADPGRGASYWTADHHEYYMLPPAHNTVVVNGLSTYGENAKPQHAMAIAHMEPESQKTALSPHISFVTGTFTYEKPVQADQRRTLAVLRMGDKTGFYFDVFRSRAHTEAGSFHDYFYHNIGQSLTISGTEPLAPTQTLADDAHLLKAYRYFKNERSAPANPDSGFHAVFTAKRSETEAASAHAVMELWMLPPRGSNGANRQVFALDAPKNNAGRHLPPLLSGSPMPTIMVRQTGEAWTKEPFVAVYAPHVSAEGPSIKGVRPLRGSDPNVPGLAACMVEGTDFRVCLMDCDETAQKTEHEAEGGVRFQGAFGVVRYENEAVAELYLAGGTRLEAGEIAAVAPDNAAPVTVSLRRDGENWTVSAHAPVQVRVPFALPPGAAASAEKYVLAYAAAAAPYGKTTPAQNAQCRVTVGKNRRRVAVVEGLVPAGQELRLRLIKTA